jgi:hypothetical protein
MPEFHEKQALSGLNYISSDLNAPGKLKRAHSAKENEQLGKKLAA